MVDLNGKLTAKGEGEATITATVGTHTAECTVTVTPAATISEMIESKKYNLALEKEVIPSGVQSDGAGTTKDKITDGYLSTAHCAVTAKDGSWSEGEPSYVIIDLGAYYKAETIDQIVIAYKNSEQNAGIVGHSYSIAFSKDGYEYTTIVDNRSIDTADNLDDADLHATIDSVSATAEYYVMTMNTGGNTAAAYSQDYKVRVYAKLADGTIVYSTVTSYNIFDIAKELYDNKKMTTGTAHESLYKVIATVDSDYTQVSYEWNNTLVKKPDTTDSLVKIEGYQMSSTFSGVNGTLGLRIVYSVDGDVKENATEVGLVYGLVYGDSPITSDDMTLDSSSPYVKSYAATATGLMDVTFGSSTTAAYYARTMNVSNLNSEGYTVSYMVRAYAKDASGNVTYSNVYTYTIGDVAAQLYNNNLMSTFYGHQLLYDKILKKVNTEYKEVEYNWNNTVVGN